MTGVRTSGGEVAADLMIDATGRRSPIDRWLAEIGARPAPNWWSECGVAYFSRHYRLRPGGDLPGLPYAQLRTAAASDPVAFRAFWKIHGTISRPDEVYADPDVVAVTRAALGEPHRAPPVAQPSRDQLLAALAGP